jgi:hypothetical protein
MYINNSQAELIFDLIAREDERLSLGEYRGNFLATREGLVELLEKIAPVIKDKFGWSDDIEFTAKAHRKALNADLAERKARILTQLNEKAGN